MTLSTPVKIVALAALALALGLAGLLLLTNKGNSSPASVTVPVVHHAAASHVVAKLHAAPIHLAAGLPPALRRALLHSREVVAIVYSSTLRTDRAAVVEARAGAHEAHVGFVALNITDNRTAIAVDRWTSVVGTPTLVVVQRPGNNPIYSITGPTDRDTVAQAAVEAK